VGLCGACFGQNHSPNSQAIFDAVQKGDLQKVLAFLDKGIDINIRGEFGYTPLIAASKYSQLEIARALCGRGADLNAATDVAELNGEWGSTPLLWAARNCHIEIARLLISNGADVARSGREGDTPLMLSSAANCKWLVRLLIEKGAPVDAVREFDGATALIEAVKNGCLDIADYLIRKGASQSAKDRDGRSMLALSARNQHYAQVRYFLDKSLPVNDQDDHGCTALYHAIGDSLESQYILEYLIRHGANARLKDKRGISPLMIASFKGLETEAKLLIDNGALVKDEDLDGETPLHYASRGISQNLDAQFISEASGMTIRLLIDKGASVNKQDHKGRTPLMNTARGDVPEVVGYLLDNGAEPNIQDNEGWTPLMRAAEWNSTAVIKVLAQRGADLGLRNSKGETALAVAKKRRSSAQAFELLKSLGARD
jgi:ankyrin repeat protein